jgi:hypothetical protein
LRAPWPSRAPARRRLAETIEALTALPDDEDPGDGLGGILDELRFWRWSWLSAF